MTTDIAPSQRPRPHDHHEKGKTMLRNERPQPYSFPANSGRIQDCPVCGSDEVGTNQGVTIGPDCIHLPAECGECESTWREVFTLNLIDDVRVSDKYKKQQETRAAYTRETLQRAYVMYESGCTHLAVTKETGLDLETAEWISSRQLDGLGLPPASPGEVAGAQIGDELQGG